MQQGRTQWRVVGEYAALQTRFNGYPETPDQQVTRVEKLASVLKVVADGQARGSELKLLVLPESIVGLHSSGLDFVLQSDWLPILKSSGISVLYGVDYALSRGRFANRAVLLRPDGTTSSISAKQTPPVAQWAPWSNTIHFPADWLSPAILEVTPGVRARVLICYEELMPVLHLISEATEDAQMVITMANHWPRGGNMVGHLQSVHTEGMARLFGRHWIRSFNSTDLHAAPNAHAS